MTTRLETANVTAGYGKITAVRDVSIVLGEDELVVVLGANGAGKTTLLSSIVGWISPVSGKVLLDGVDITSAEVWQRVHNGIGFVPEGGRVFGDLTVGENLDVVRPTTDGLARALDLFPILKERLDQVASTLSGGQRQMLALARAVATNPRVLLVDEASLGLMPTLVTEVFATLRSLCDDGLPILLVEQNTQALSIADRGYVMETGSIQGEGTTEELAEDPAIRSAYLGTEEDDG